MRFLALLTFIIAILSIGLFFGNLQSPYPPSLLGSKLGAATAEPEATPSPETYKILIEELETKRSQFSQRYNNSNNEAEKQAIEEEARSLLESELPKLMKCWIGTPWDFNGTSDTPGQGKIACGYFVSTVLRDAGFEVERFRLAQQASQNIIATFLPRNELHITASTSYEKFLKQVISRGPGVRIVGLDSHVAFLIVNKDLSINFIHSSGIRPWAVVNESKNEALVLQASNYRVTGNLTGNSQVIKGWLNQSKWPTKT